MPLISAFFSSKKWAYSTIPPSSQYEYSIGSSGLESFNDILKPLFKKASCWIRLLSVSRSYTVVSVNIWASALNVTFEPVSRASQSPNISRSLATIPRSNLSSYICPLRLTRTSSHSDKALTTEAPTPWSPPDTLYDLPSNLPPAWSNVKIVSTAGR